MTRVLSCMLLAACAALAGERADAGEETIVLTDAPGRDVTATRCVTCHSLDYIQMHAPILDRAGWGKNVRKMIDRFGAPITPEETDEILGYLAAHYSIEN